ncbi:hypothetical protein HW532_15865 [Kaustia mangrovi]|uniref:Uncharacterized protein n=1 Tax=Kaustia mangrovi TaxID=2593653 RepID=A0A7S8HD79_9HYPH|nr:hypothetical protein [Kaustia mangrovi]QPC44038.1 hypothetical protein HW532_15865 [Kaustia mangrovi]
MTRDEALHVAGAVPIVAAALLLPWGLGAVVVNAALWILREVAQNGWAVHEWSWHVHREWLFPAAAGAIVWGLWAIWTMVI